jgi:hypothetical protein
MAALLLGLLLAACSDGERSATTSSRPESSASLELTSTELRAMMPTRRELDLPLWGVMSPAERVAGSMDNRRAATETALWSVTRQDLDSAGRTGGYIQYFWDGGCGGTCLKRPLLGLRTEAHVFGDPVAASRFLLASASRYRAQNGKPDGRCGRVFVEQSEPPALGDEAIALRTLVGECESLTGYTWRDTIFLFRVDRIVCLALAASLNDAYPDRRAAEAARMLDRRVEAVLSAA